jgi:hypothetical protein
MRLYINVTSVRDSDTANIGWFVERRQDSKPGPIYRLNAPKCRFAVALAGVPVAIGSRAPRRTARLSPPRLALWLGLHRKKSAVIGLRPVAVGIASGWAVGVDGAAD